MLILITVYPEEYNGERQKIKTKSVIIRYKIKENCFQNWHQCSGTTLRQEKASRREGCRMQREGNNRPSLSWREDCSGEYRDTCSDSVLMRYLGDWELSVTRDFVSPKAQASEKTRQSRKSGREMELQVWNNLTVFGLWDWEFTIVVKAVDILWNWKQTIRRSFQQH